MSKGGARLFFNTMRRQHPKCVGDDDLRNLHNYLRAHATYWLVVEEKLAPETHFHIVELWQIGVTKSVPTTARTTALESLEQCCRSLHYM